MSSRCHQSEVALVIVDSSGGLTVGLAQQASVGKIHTGSLLQVVTGHAHVKVGLLLPAGGELGSCSRRRIPMAEDWIQRESASGNSAVGEAGRWLAVILGRGIVARLGVHVGDGTRKLNGERIQEQQRFALTDCKFL